MMVSEDSGKILISIVMVSYNKCQYIDEAINSCLKQKLNGKIELIIGDDGSDDGSLEIIKKYSEEYPNEIKYFTMERNMDDEFIPSIRVSNVLKRGFEMAKGKYVAVLSADDYFSADTKFSVQIAFLEKNADYTSCYTAYKKVWSDGNEIVYRPRRGEDGSLLWAQGYIHISAFVFRKEILATLLSRMLDDTGLLYVILVSGKSHYIPVDMYAYRQCDNSIMHKADNIELEILEMMLFQDILNVSGGGRASSLSRFSYAIEQMIKHRKNLNDVKYQKYKKNSVRYPNDVLKKIEEGSRWRLLLLVVISRICRWGYMLLHLMNIAIGFNDH